MIKTSFALFTLLGFQKRPSAKKHLSQLKPLIFLRIDRKPGNKQVEGVDMSVQGSQLHWAWTSFLMALSVQSVEAEESKQISGDTRGQKEVERSQFFLLLQQIGAS